jgi:alcohol dehydrogenase class IV
VCERLDAAGHAVPLSALGVTEADVPILAEEAAVQWTARFNPRAVTAEDFVRLYSAAL